MAINKTMQAALKALSYSAPDIEKVYKVKRQAEDIKAKHTPIPDTCTIEDITIPVSYPATPFRSMDEADQFAEDAVINDIPVRIFAPKGRSSKGLIIFFHGGGWVIGNVDTYTNVCVHMVEQLQRTVLSVDYRRAPEYKFPCATEDCYAVAKAVYCEGLMPEFTAHQITLVGDSAGGNIAAAVSLMARDRKEFRVHRQILIYPATYNDHGANSPYPSIKENGTDYLLTSKRVVSYMEMYIGNQEDLQNPYLAPLLASDFSHQPRTLIISAEYCPLRDEGEDYGRKLQEAGNQVNIYRMPDALHGYFSLPIKFKIVRKTYSIMRRFLGDDQIAKQAEHATTRWNRMDNAANIFPSTSGKLDTKVFRFYCALEEDVNQRCLNAALDATIKQYPIYRSMIRKGLFWYYFEDSTFQPIVREEYREPCAALYDNNHKGLLFEVSYYENRINLEVYHALADGTGAMNFFKTLIVHYLRIRYHLPEEALPPASDTATMNQRGMDSFAKFYDKKNKVKKERVKSKHVNAYHVHGPKLEQHPLGVIEGHMSVQQLLTQSRANGCTITELLLAILIRSIGDGMSIAEQRRPIVVSVPLDFRRFFPSETSRNFFGVIRVTYNFATQSGELADIIHYVHNFMHHELQPEQVAVRMADAASVGKILPARIAPIVLKDPSLKIANSFFGRGMTAQFSNLGQIKLPEACQQYVKNIGVISSTKRFQACLCSFKDTFVIGFTAPFVSTDIQCRFFRRLVQMGIDVDIISNLGCDTNVVL